MRTRAALPARAREQASMPACIREPPASCLHHALMQPDDRIERREDRALLPGRQGGSMLAREHDAAVDLAEIFVMLRAPLLRPVAAAAERERHAMPGHRDAVLELAPVLRMDGR